MRRVIGAWARRPAGAGAVLFAAYVVVSLTVSPEGYLGTDTGAKVATLEAMARDDSWHPDLGYWAEDLDPTGRLHPVHDTRLTDEGWVHVTTLPMLLAARPLYELGGYRLALLLPMAGGVGAALAARSLARQLGGEREGTAAFWLVGAASPVAVYALDLWEHSIGVAAMVGAVALLLPLGLAERPPGELWRPLLAGALFGAAATLRTEALVYTFVATATVCVAALAVTRSPRRAVQTGALTVLGFAPPWLANSALEAAVGGLSRTERATGRSEVVGSGLGSRVEVGLQTVLGFNAGAVVPSVLAGAALVAVVGLAVRASARGDQRLAVVGLVAVGAAHLAASINGLGFVPGALVAFPVALVALLVPPSDVPGRLLVAMAVAAMPLVFLVQPIQGAGPQWGGRYLLTSSVVLGVVGLQRLTTRAVALRRGLVALSAIVTALGVAWLGVRSYSAERFFDDVVERSEPVLIARQAFLLREAGPELLGRRWLTVADEDAFAAAIEVARATGEERFSVIEWEAPAPPAAVLPDDVTEVQRAELDFAGTPVGLVTYEFSGP